MIRQKTSQFFLKTNVFVKIPFLHFACVWFHIIQIIHIFCSVWLLTKIHCHLLGTTQFPWFTTCSTCGKEWILWMTFFTFNLLQEKAKFKVTITELIRVLIAVFSPANVRVLRVPRADLYQICNPSLRSKHLRNLRLFIKMSKGSIFFGMVGKRRTHNLTFFCFVTEPLCFRVLLFVRGSLLMLGWNHLLLSNQYTNPLQATSAADMHYISISRYIKCTYFSAKKPSVAPIFAFLLAIRAASEWIHM